MADDEDSGESFMRKHMSEAQPSNQMGGFGNMPQRKLSRKLTDMNIMKHYGKDVDLSDDQTPQTVNRGAKRDFDPDG